MAKVNCSKCNKQIQVTFIEALAYALDDENKIKFECSSCSGADELLKELCLKLSKESSGIFSYRPTERSGIFKEVRK